MNAKAAIAVRHVPEPLPAANKLAYRVGEAADALGVSVATVWRRIAEKKIATKKDGGNTLILRSELERFLADLPQGNVR